MAKYGLKAATLAPAAKRIGDEGAAIRIHRAQQLADRLRIGDRREVLLLDGR